MEAYSLRFPFSVRLLISPLILNESLAGESSLGCRPLFFIIWNISCYSLLDWGVSIDKSAANLIGVPLYVTSCFSLAAFRILSLSLNFAILIVMCFGVGLFWFLLIGTLSASWTCSSHQIREVSHHYFFKQVFYSLLFFFTLWYPYDTDIIMFHVVLHFS